jgi:hypothetical protein
LSIAVAKSAGGGKTAIGVAPVILDEDERCTASTTPTTTRASPAADAGMTIRLGTFPPPSTSASYEIGIEKPMRASVLAFIPLSHRIKNPRKAGGFLGSGQVFAFVGNPRR